MLLHELLQHAARRAPDAPALVADGRTRSFAELLDGAMRLSGFLQEHTAPGDRVAVVADNAGAWIDCYYGVPHAGAILTPINQRLALGEQAALIAAAEPAVLLGERSRLEALAPVVTAPLVHAFEDGWDDHVPARVPRHHDIAWLLFTSGTTGQPKGALLTHASLTAAAIGTALARPTAPDDVFLTPFPLCHVAGYNVFVFHLHGRPAVVLPRFRPDDLVAHVRAHDVTVCSLAPTMLVTLLDHLDATGTTLPSLRTITYGASPISPALRRRAEDRLGVALREGYGMTELSGNAVFDGVPSPLVSVRLGADDEILVRGDQVTIGYWRDPDATASAFTDGWFHTGDVGRWGGGRLHVVDRLKDIVITGGENVASREVEDVLHDHPAVAAAAIVGVPDDRWGEAICAVVVPRPGTNPTADELVAHVRERLAGFKQPRHVVFLEALPVNAAGKVQKAELRRLAAQVVARAR